MTTIAIFDNNIIRASSLLQAINNIEGFSCTHIFCYENDLSQIKIDIDLVLFCLDTEAAISKYQIDLISLQFDQAKFILCADNLSINQVIEGIKYGISGFFTINSTVDQLDTVLISVRDFQAYLPPYIFKNLLNTLNINTVNSNNLLTKREAEICLLLQEGKTYEQIAEVCKVSINTVRFFIKSIYRKNGVKSKIQLLNKLQMARMPFVLR